jgi:hypothetical protein
VPSLPFARRSLLDVLGSLATYLSLPSSTDGGDIQTDTNVPSHHLSIGALGEELAKISCAGTLDMLVRSTLTRGPRHGYGIAQRVKELSQDVLHVGESSLYPRCNASCSTATSNRSGAHPRTTDAHGI